MKKSKPTKLLLGFLGIATFASLVGTVSGTLAWYSYSTRATLSYSGTSVNNTVQLQIGIASQFPVKSVSEIRAELANNDEMEDEEKDKIESWFKAFWDVVEPVKWNDDSNYYYFAPIGSGLDSKVINAYLKSSGFGSDYLCPVTSGSFKRGDSFTLKSSPSRDSERSLQVAKKEHYSTIPFVFRVIRTNTVSADVFEPNIELWLTDATVRASSIDDGNVYKGIRMFVDRGSDYANDYIVNPSAAVPGKTAVAGVLDIDGDHYYDYDNNSNEVIYGDYETIGGISSSGYSGDDKIADINGTGKTGEEFDTFSARHRQGINYYDNYNDCVFKYAEYESLSSIAPLKDEVTGALTNRDPINPSSVCKTGDSASHYLGRVDFTIYFEGWDHSIVDEELEHMFDLGLTFEINKL